MSIKEIPTHVLRKASERYGLTASDLRLFSKSESGNVIYRYQVSHNEFILKLIPHSDKDKKFVKNSLESELDWINYLADNGVNTPRVITSKQNNPVELIDLDSKSFFSIVSFEKATGRQISQSDFGAELFAKLGGFAGKMHSLAKQYKPGKHVHKRPEWYEDESLDIDKLIPSADSKLVEKSWELVNSLKNLPRNPDVYGLIHGDMQEHNLYLCDGDIIVLDFENCIYCWYILDFVSSLEGVIGHMPFGEEMENLTVYFSENYWKGYKQANHIELFCFQKIPEFFKLWELFLYSEFINEWDMTDLTEKRKRLLDSYRSDIITGNRFSNMDFERFYHV
jgi:Ser/Thr protein kinase RdoA (MazF antagonist)